MGIYAEYDLNGQPLPVQGKAAALEASGAHIIRNIIQWDDSYINRLLCVIDNGAFDAAAIVTDRSELERFRRGMAGRWADWVLVPDAKSLMYPPATRESHYTPDPRD